MVSAVNNNGAQTPPTQPLGGNPAGNGTTPALSQSSSLTGSSSAAAAPAAGVTGAADSGSTGQTPNAANDFRQLFWRHCAFWPPRTPPRRLPTRRISVEPARPRRAAKPPSSAALARGCDNCRHTFRPGVSRTATVARRNQRLANEYQLFRGPSYGSMARQQVRERPGCPNTPSLATGDPTRRASTRTILCWRMASKVNAGLLASYYVRNPESDFPGLAETLIQSQLAQARLGLAYLIGTRDGLPNWGRPVQDGRDAEIHIGAPGCISEGTWKVTMYTPTWSGL